MQACFCRRVAGGSLPGPRIRGLSGHEDKRLTRRRVRTDSSAEAQPFLWTGSSCPRQPPSKSSNTTGPCAGAKVFQLGRSGCGLHYRRWRKMLSMTSGSSMKLMIFIAWPHGEHARSTHFPDLLNELFSVLWRHARGPIAGSRYYGAPTRVIATRQMLCRFRHLPTITKKFRLCYVQLSSAYYMRAADLCRHPEHMRYVGRPCASFPHWQPVMTSDAGRRV